MASSIKVILRKKANKQGLYPLVVRIIKDRKPSYYYVGHYIDIKHWDEDQNKVRKSHPNATRLNNMIAQKLAEANKTLLDLQGAHNDISSKQIKKEIKNPLSRTSFNEVARTYLNGLENDKKYTRFSSDKSRINHFIEFAENDSILFSEIDVAMLKRYMSYLKVKRGNSQRSIINSLVVIRTIYNQAISLGVVERKHYPFGRNKIKIKYPETEKIGLNINEVRAIEQLAELTPQEIHTRNVWLFSFYLAGIRVADVLKIKWSDIYDGRLHYRMNKNDKLLSLKLPEKVMPILDYYDWDKESRDDFIFPELKHANLNSEKDILAKTKTANKKFNKYLESIRGKADISKKITMHIARHTFGNISGDSIPIQILQKLYRHSSITTTINYQSNFTHKDEDEALDKVINF